MDERARLQRGSREAVPDAAAEPKENETDRKRQEEDAEAEVEREKEKERIQQEKDISDAAERKQNKLEESKKKAADSEKII